MDYELKNDQSFVDDKECNTRQNHSIKNTSNTNEDQNNEEEVEEEIFSGIIESELPVFIAKAQALEEKVFKFKIS